MFWSRLLTFIRTDEAGNLGVLQRSDFLPRLQFRITCEALKKSTKGLIPRDSNLNWFGTGHRYLFFFFFLSFLGDYNVQPGLKSMGSRSVILKLHKNHLGILTQDSSIRSLSSCFRLLRKFKLFLFTPYLGFSNIQI